MSEEHCYGVRVLVNFELQRQGGRPAETQPTLVAPRAADGSCEPQKKKTLTYWVPCLDSHEAVSIVHSILTMKVSD